MIKFLTLLLFTSSSAWATSLPNKALLSLKKWNQDFKMYSTDDYNQKVLDLFKNDEQPMIFSADLNSDQQTDYVVLGKDKKKSYVIALMGEKKKWKTIEVSSWVEDDKKISVYITPASEGIADQIKPQKAIQIERYLVQPEVYQIKNNKAVKLSI